MKNTLLYTRVSTTEQAQHGFSLDAQEANLRHYAVGRGLDVVMVVRDEGVSGGKPLGKRPGGAKVLKIVKEGEVAHVLAWRLDRVFRNTQDALQHAAAWDKRDVVLHLLDFAGSTVDTRSAAGKLIFTVLSALGEFERKRTGERIAEVLAYKKKKGEIYSRDVYGFSKNCTKLLPDSEELAVVEELRQKRAVGCSLRQLAADLNARGVPTKRGARWHASTVKYLLENDLYAAIG